MVDVSETSKNGCLFHSRLDRVQFMGDVLPNVSKDQLVLSVLRKYKMQTYIYASYIFLPGSFLRFQKVMIHVLFLFISKF